MHTGKSKPKSGGSKGGSGGPFRKAPQGSMSIKKDPVGSMKVQKRVVGTMSKGG